MLIIKNFSKTINTTTILKDINLTINDGQICGIVGASGAGKSTLLRCIQGLDNNYDGEIIRSGVCGFMFQDFQLFPHMTVFENIIYSPKINKIDFDYCKAAKDLLDNMGIENKKNHYPSQLSGGQKQKVALARTMILQPQILLCDEPTSGLDLASIEEISELLKKSKAKGTTVLISSHDVDFLSKTCDKAIIIKNNTIFNKENNTNISLDDYIN